MNPTTSNPAVPETLPPKPRRKRRRIIELHSGRCEICNHPDRTIIEDRYARYEPLRRIAKDYGFSHSAIQRHVDYFLLNKSRTRKLERLAARYGAV